MKFLIPFLLLASPAFAQEQVAVVYVQQAESRSITNEYGDQLIGTTLRLVVQDTLRGAPEREVIVEAEGGTLDGITLEVSHIEPLHPGQRAVVFLSSGRVQQAYRILAGDHIPGLGQTVAALKRSLR